MTARLALASLLLFVPSLAAQQPVVKEEIVVTPQRGAEPRDEVAAAVTVVTRANVEQLPVASLAEVLNRVPGVTVFNDADFTGQPPMLTARGFFGGGEVEYIKLLVDGVPVGDAESGLADWRRLRVGGIERIELLHGPASSVYGDTALGGVVQLFTTPASVANGFSGDVRISGGSFDSRALDGALRFDHESLRASGTFFVAETNGYREHAANDDRAAELSLQRLEDVSRIQLALSLSHKDREDPGPLTPDLLDGDRRAANPLYADDVEETSRRRLSASYERFDARPLRASVYATGRDTDWTRTLLLAPTFASTLVRDVETSGIGGTLDVSREWRGATLRGGADLARDTLDGRYSEQGGGVVGEVDVSRNSRALFATISRPLGARTQLSAGLRHDDIGDQSAWSPRAGVNVHLGDEAASPYVVFVQASRSFKAPTLDQLYDPRPFPGPGFSFTISNPTLEPQRASNIELGLSRTTPAAAWSLTAYDMHVDDEIDLDLTTFTYRNIGSSRHRGLEVGAALSPSARIRPQLTYAWTRVHAEGSDRQLKNIPEHVGTIAVAATLPYAMQANVAWRHLGRRYLADEGDMALPSVGRLDIRLERLFARMRVQLDVLNATDRTYSEVGFVLPDFSGDMVPLAFPSPGRAIRLGAVWKFE